MHNPTMAPACAPSLRWAMQVSQQPTIDKSSYYVQYETQQRIAAMRALRAAAQRMTSLPQSSLSFAPGSAHWMELVLPEFTQDLIDSSHTVDIIVRGWCG